MAIDFGPTLSGLGSSGSYDIGYNLGSGVGDSFVSDKAIQSFSDQSNNFSYMDDSQYAELTGNSNYTPGSGVPGGDIAPTDDWESAISSDDLLKALAGEQDWNQFDKETDEYIKYRNAQTKTPGGDEKGMLDSLLKKVEDPKVLSALITAGMGMLSGASKGKMQEKAWKREDDIRQQEIARKNANSRPGAVGKMTWSPANASGTGLLGAKVG